MMDKRKEQEWLSSFSEFLKADEMPPSQVTQGILTSVRAELNPAFGHVLVKFAALTVGAAAVTLLFCPQLGFGPLWFDLGLQHLVMRFGSGACAAFCGSLFLATSIFLSAWLLRPEERRVVAAHQLVTLSTVCAILFAALMVLGGDAVQWDTLFWFGGALLGGAFGFWLMPRLPRIAFHF